ncbi:calcium-binding protein [Gemmobacter serpentinus]|uniref:calcium-binding protein n=1 Tax=Gemmobacter serpentinus TaxID=2652247 RepID=UPI00124CA398|nr:calcium-binding protein [Gemmobacter serpentinus]
MAQQSFVFDGTTAISTVPFFWTASWNNKWLPYVSFWNGNVAGPHSADIRLTGSDWGMHVIRFAGDGGIKATFTDATSGANRQIQMIQLSEAGGQINLDITQVDEILSNDDGNTVIKTTRHHIKSIDLSDGDDRVTIGNGANYIDLGGGKNSLTVRGADSNVHYVSGYQGRNTISVEGEARIFAVKLDDGVNSFTTKAGFTESFTSHNGVNTLNIGTGGIGSIQFFGDGDKLQVVKAAGWVGSLKVGDDQRIQLTLGAGGADMVQLGRGADVVTTGAGWVGYMATSDGNDVVNIGPGGIDTLRLSKGNDIAKLRGALTDDTGISGGNGIDTLDLSDVAGNGVRVDLSNSNWQKFSAAAGLLRVSGIEVLIGTDKADTLEGDNANNTLTGGKGNDRLIGNDGADTFRFGRATGTDRILDFELREDRIAFSGASSLSSLKFSQSGDDVRVSFGESVVFVEDVTVSQLRVAANFIF